MPSTLVWTSHALPTNAPDPSMLPFWSNECWLEVTNRCTMYLLAWHHQRLCTEPETRLQLEQVTCDCGWWRFLVVSIGSMPSDTSQWWCPPLTCKSVYTVKGAPHFSLSPAEIIGYTYISKEAIPLRTSGCPQGQRHDHKEKWSTL